MNTRSCLLFLLICIWLSYSCTRSEGIRRQVHFPAGVSVDTIPFKFSGSGHILVSVRVGGNDYDLVFDSGSERTIFGENVTLDRFSEEAAIIADANSEKYLASMAAIDTLGIGQLSVTGLRWVLQTDLREGDENGILGGDVLRNLAWKIDFAKRQIYIARDAGDFESIEKRKGIHFRLRENVPYLSYRINGIDVASLMDTGDNGCVCVSNALLEAYPERFGNYAIAWCTLPEKNNNFEAYIHEPRLHSVVDTFSYTEGQIEIDGHTLRHELIQFVPSVRSSGIGLDLFQRFDHIVLDYPNRKLFLGNPQYKSFRYLNTLTTRINSMGVQLSRDSVPIVRGISSLLAGNDIRLGDTVVAIDGVSFFNQPPSFYKDSLNTVNKVTTIIPAKHTRLLDQFTYRNDTATLSIKRQSGIHQVNLVRGNPATYLPDTVIHIADGLPLAGYILRASHKVKDERGLYHLLETRKRPFIADDNH